MRIAAFFMPLFALLSGAVGFYLRLNELWNVFDIRTGLPERGATETYTLITASGVFLLLFLLFSVMVAVKRSSPKGFENSFGTHPLTYPFTFAIIAMVWLGASVKHFLDHFSMQPMPMVEIYFSALSALAAVSVALFAIEMYQDPRRKMTFAMSIVPTVFMCFWLGIMYRDNASNPILLSYVYEFLAIISSALAFYFTSGFVYNKPSPPASLFFYFTAVYFCFVTLADGHSVTVKLIFCSILAMNIVYSAKLIRHLRRKESKKALQDY